MDIAFAGLHEIALSNSKNALFTDAQPPQLAPGLSHGPGREHCECFA